MIEKSEVCSNEVGYKSLDWHTMTEVDRVTAAVSEAVNQREPTPSAFQ